MEFFPDGAQVRLRSILVSTYLHADVDGVGMSLTTYRASLSTAWTVRHLVRHGATYVLLDGAAYDGYLALIRTEVGAGSHSQSIVQLIRDGEEEDDDMLWVPVATGPSDGTASVLLRHGTHDAYFLTVVGASFVTAAPGSEETRSKDKEWAIEVLPHNNSALPFPRLIQSASDFDTADLLTAIEFFPDDRAHVRFRSRTSGLFLFAGEDGVRVAFRPHRETLNTVWVVHQVLRRGAIYVLLHSAAYGRYLAMSGRASPWPFVQNYYFHDERQREILWILFRRPSDRTVVMQNARYGVFFEQWEVEHVPLRARPPLLPSPSDAQVNAMWRNVAYIQGDEFGNYDQRGWIRTKFLGCSISRLREMIAAELDEEYPVRITLCIWSGYLGRLTPLDVDLPKNKYTIRIVVYVSSAPAALAMPHPNVDAPPEPDL